MPPSADGEQLDVIVVGAGLSGIAAGHYLRTLCPGHRFAILEARDRLGGTWDLFRYPGVRSDSDMYTLGYSFRPWASDASFAPGPVIREYVADTAREEGLLPLIRFGHRVVGAAWDSAAALWTVVVEHDGRTSELRCRFLFFCSGYYDYEQGHEPEWPGREDFTGRVVHPQQWPEDLDYAGKRVVIIGSGATAVTLLPAMAREAAHVTMLQRSPTWIAALPARDGIAAWARRRLPAGLAHALVRWKNVLLSMALFQFSKHRPQAVGRWLLGTARRLLPADFDVRRHLKPDYDPWDQRLCIAPDGDLFRAVREGRGAIVTDRIDRFTPGGIRLASGEELPADIVVTATGLKLKMMGGARLVVDGRRIDLAETLAYRGMMYGGIPNLALAMGYTNASWTLKCELIARHVCRLLNHMRARGYEICVPVPPAGQALPTRPAIDLNSGYVQRAAALLPKQGDRKPWRIYQNYLLDLWSLKFSGLRDGALRFARRGALPGPTTP